jgi:peptidoglycan/xylan/chitin deacetylase (PgdA/CDA1 family)
MRDLFYLFLVYVSPLYRLFSKNRLRVLAYHTVPDQEKFEKQVEYLNKNFNIISVPQLQQIIFNKSKVPSNSVLITFDDGDVSVLENGLPVLKKFNSPSALFIITKLIDTTDTFWPRWVERSFSKDGKTYAEARRKVNQLKVVSNIEREKYLETLEQITSPQLTHLDLKKMEKAGIFIGNHTHSHPMINKCSEEEITLELDQVRKKFDEWSLPGYPVFAYPNGNWDEKAEKIMFNKGIKLAFLFDHKLATIPINPLRISRIRVNADSEMNEFKAKVAGVHSALMNIKNNF